MWTLKFPLLLLDRSAQFLKQKGPGDHRPDLLYVLATR